MRMNFPSRHPLKMGAGVPVGDADLVLGLEHPELFMNLNALTPVNRMGMAARPLFKPGTKDRHHQCLGADHQEQLPGHRPLCRGRPGHRRRHRGHAPGAHRGVPAADHAGPEARDSSSAAPGPRPPRREAFEQGLEQAAWGWDASPISTARLSAEIWNQIKDEDWSLVSDVVVHQQLAAPALGLHEAPPVHRLVGRVRHRLRRAGGGRRRAGQPEARSAQREHPVRRRPQLRAGVLWTAAHHRIPLLTVMHNNRAYHQERMFITDVAAKVKRDVRRAGIGNDLTDPNIDYASLAKAYGVHGIGPIEHPADLGPALEARDRGGEARRAGARGRRHAAEVRRRTGSRRTGDAGDRRYRAAAAPRTTMQTGTDSHGGDVRSCFASLAAAAIAARRPCRRHRAMPRRARVAFIDYNCS